MRVLIAGGGTGGHLYPGIAVAEEVTARGGQALFVGTSRGLEARVVPAAGYGLETIEVSGLKRVGIARQIGGLARLPAAFARSLAIVRRFRPDVVLGVGGYASGPVVLAAALSGYPTAIQEQNSVPGFTNRALGRLAHVVFVAFEDARRFFPERKVELVGNPVRRSFVEASARASSPSGGGRLLVVGGSQGARAVNDLVLGAAEILSGAGKLPPMLHQSGQADAERCSQRYRALGLDTRVAVTSFIDDMPAALSNANLVIARAGALTLAELAVIGRAAVLIPLPTAADDHQRTNAQAFVRAGAAEMMDQVTATPASLAAFLATLLADVERRRSMSAAMTRLGRPGAASALVDRLEALGR